MIIMKSLKTTMKHSIAFNSIGLLSEALFKKDKSKVCTIYIITSDRNFSTK